MAFMNSEGTHHFNRLYEKSRMDTHKGYRQSGPKPLVGMQEVGFRRTQATKLTGPDEMVVAFD
jgi:hypothetical protein